MSSIVICRFFLDVRQIHVDRSLCGPTETPLPITSVRVVTGWIEWARETILEDLSGPLGGEALEREQRPDEVQLTQVSSHRVARDPKIPQSEDETVRSKQAVSGRKPNHQV